MVTAGEHGQPHRQAARPRGVGEFLGLPLELGKLRAADREVQRRAALRQRPERAQGRDLGLVEGELLVEIVKRDRLEVEYAAGRRSHRRGNRSINREATDLCGGPGGGDTPRPTCGPFPGYGLTATSGNGLSVVRNEARQAQGWG